jgi:hypothetical protein
VHGDRSHDAGDDPRHDRSSRQGHWETEASITDNSRNARQYEWLENTVKQTTEGTRHALDNLCSSLDSLATRDGKRLHVRWTHPSIARGSSHIANRSVAKRPAGCAVGSGNRPSASSLGEGRTFVSGPSPGKSRPSGSRGGRPYWSPVPLPEWSPPVPPAPSLEKTTRLKKQSIRKQIDLPEGKPRHSSSNRF